VIELDCNTRIFLADMQSDASCQCKPNPVPMIYVSKFFP